MAGAVVFHIRLEEQKPKEIGGEIIQGSVSEVRGDMYIIVFDRPVSIDGDNRLFYEIPLSKRFGGGKWAKGKKVRFYSAGVEEYVTRLVNFPVDIEKRDDIEEMGEED